METKERPKKKFWIIFFVVFLLLLCCVIPTSLFFVKEGRTFYKNILKFMNVPIDEDSDSDNGDIKLEEEEHLIIEAEENGLIGGIKVYTSEFFPELYIEYPKSWILSEKVTDSTMTGAKDVTLKFEKSGYTLQFSIMPVGPVGLYADCYTEDKLDYVRIQKEYVRNYDGENYFYGYLYDSDFRANDFEEARSFEGYGDEYIACGDLHILGILKTSFFDKDFFSDDYLYALVGASLYEKGVRNEDILLEADAIVKYFLE
jgi:hypothetical protein